MSDLSTLPAAVVAGSKRLRRDSDDDRSLGSIMCVSHDWQSAVLSMPSVRTAATILLSQWESTSAALSCAHSRLSRHVIRFAGDPELRVETPSKLDVLSSRMPQLEWLNCALMEQDASTPTAIGRWQKLQDLKIYLSGFTDHSPHCVRFNSIFHAIAQLPSLHTLNVDIRGLDPNYSPVSFRSLAAAASLRSLTLTSKNGITLSDRQIDELRALHWLTHIDWGSDDYLVHMLQLQENEMNASAAALLSSPPPLQWRSLPFQVDLDDSLTPRLLRHLPNLTHVHAVLKSVRTPLLHALPQLRSLWLTQYPVLDLGAAATRTFMLELGCCTQLTDLTLSSLLGVDADLLAAVLPSMPLLSRLQLDGLPSLASLHFLATPTLAASLTQLTIYHCEACPHSSVAGLHGLRSLQELTLELHDNVPLPSDLRLPFLPPMSALLFPHLTLFALAYSHRPRNLFDDFLAL